MLEAPQPQSRHPCVAHVPQLRSSNDGVPQQPIEPGYGAFGVTDGAGLLDAPDEGRLENLLGLGAASHAALEEGPEPPMILHQCLDDARVADSLRRAE